MTTGRINQGASCVRSRLLAVEQRERQRYAATDTPRGRAVRVSTRAPYRFGSDLPTPSIFDFGVETIAESPATKVLVVSARLNSLKKRSSANDTFVRTAVLRRARLYIRHRELACIVLCTSRLSDDTSYSTEPSGRAVGDARSVLFYGSEVRTDHTKFLRHVFTNSFAIRPRNDRLELGAHLAECRQDARKISKREPKFSPRASCCFYLVVTSERSDRQSSRASCCFGTYGSDNKVREPCVTTARGCFRTFRAINFFLVLLSAVATFERFGQQSPRALCYYCSGLLPNVSGNQLFVLRIVFLCYLSYFLVKLLSSGSDNKLNFRVLCCFSSSLLAIVYVLKSRVIFLSSS
ncbi:hypothetical protein PUN28_020407 [Cardiocondyla obscurior]|uniref:Uncharacterized protein n=1 Tax=Cardiocondyla obscurior TaxID=286306 RepID=A0AAW2E476_9HYME